MLKRRLATIAIVLSAGAVLAASGCAPAAQTATRAATPTTAAMAAAAPTQMPPSTPTLPKASATLQIAPQGAPALTVGTLEQAGKALSVTITLPRYLPAGAVREEVVRYFVRDGRGLASVEYRVGQRSFTVQYVKEPASAFAERQGQPTKVGRFSAKVQTQAKEPSDPGPANSALAWRDGEVTVIVQGDLPVEELQRVAESLSA